MRNSEKKLNRKYNDEMVKMFGPVGPNYAKEELVAALQDEYASLKAEHGEDRADKFLADRLITKHLG